MEVITKMSSHPNKPQSQQSHEVTNPPNDSKKRKFSDVDVSHSPYFKIRALVQQLRPHVIEVLRTPDFRNCEAANEIRRRMNLVMHLYKQIQVEGDQIGSWGMSACQPLLGERNPEKGHLGEPRHTGTQEERLQAKADPEKLAENKLPPSHISSGEKVDDYRTSGSYIVGNSVVGRNFITFTNIRPPECYGETKESYRHRRNKS